MSRFAVALRHLPPAILFVGLALAWTWPLASHLASAIPGHPGDNLAFLWNIWWMRTALATGTVALFHTNDLFAPFGIDLALHTHTAFPAWIAGTLLGRYPATTAQNLVILASLAGNGFAAYLLAWDRTRDRAGALVAGLVFGGAPYLSAHLLGHFNLICAWGLPLFALFLLRALERRSWRASAAAGAVVVLTAYCDYYYVVYEAVLAAGVCLAGVGGVRLNWARRRLPSWAVVGAVALLVIDALLIAFIVLGGGFDRVVLGVRIVATRPTNPLAMAWLLLAILALAHFRPRVGICVGVSWRLSGAQMTERLRLLLPMVTVIAVGLAPLARRAWALMVRGDYTAPSPSWRSGPAGVDLATLFLGNPQHGWFGGSVSHAYERLGIDPIEGGAWLGLVPLVFIAWAVVGLHGRLRDDREARRWLAVAAVFFLWALGPWLHIAGVDTGLLLPQNLLAFVPIVSNARMPGRALVVVCLAVGVLMAIVLSRMPPARRRIVALATAALIAVDYWPAPFPLTQIETPALYARLRDMPAGAVCELPMGIRDGFGLRGVFDDRVLSYQMTHGHPLVGGFAARVPASIVRGYEQMPVVRSLWRLSEGKDVDPRDDVLTREETGAALARATVSFVVLNRMTASAPLVRYLERAVPLALVAKDGARELYTVTSRGAGPS